MAKKRKKTVRACVRTKSKKVVCGVRVKKPKRRKGRR